MSTDIPIVPPPEHTTTAPLLGVPALGRPLLVIDGNIGVPAGLCDAESVRRWTLSPGFPLGLKAAWRRGTLWLETPTGPCFSRLKLSDPLPPVPPTGAAVVIDGEMWVPTTVVDLASFRQWALSQEWPRNLRLSYLNGLLWIDRTMEQMYTHNRVKTEVATKLDTLTKATRQGIYLSDGMRWSNPAANFATEPDGLFVTYASLQTGRVLRVAGRIRGVIDLEGSPEMVLEVVSDSSVHKDMVELPTQYHQGGMDEFWRIDVCGTDPVFEILRSTAAGYVPTQLPDGWWRSDIFAHDFRLIVQQDPLGDPLFVLEMR
jgi:Uma2 family endonuclease